MKVPNLLKTRDIKQGTTEIRLTGYDADPRVRGSLREFVQSNSGLIPLVEIFSSCPGVWSDRQPLSSRGSRGGCRFHRRFRFEIGFTYLVVMTHSHVSPVGVSDAGHGATESE